MGKKHCWKMRNCSSPAISPFPAVFSEDLYCRPVESRFVWERVKTCWDRKPLRQQINADSDYRVAFEKVLGKVENTGYWPFLPQSFQMFLNAKPRDNFV